MSTLKKGASRLRNTPQTEAMPGREADAVCNNAGGMVFTVSPWQQLMRFLILGSESGSYYVSEDEHTRLNSEVLLKLIGEDGERVVKLAVEVSDQGRALKNDPALFALAMAITLGNAATKQAVVDALPKVARIPTHLFHFVAFATAARGWGSALKRAVARWYRSQTPQRLAEHVTKYPSRDGWSHLDVLRLSRGLDLTIPILLELYDWVNGKERDYGGYLAVVDQVRRLDVGRGSLPELLGLIAEHRLPREVLPTGWLAMPEVWAALLPYMPVHAVLRNLGTLSKLGVFDDRSLLSYATGRLTDADALHRARVHPLQMLVAAKVYGQGHGIRGRGAWRFISQVADALDAGFSLAFRGLEPTGKRFLLALDVSSSMGWSPCVGAPLMASEAAAGVAVTIARTEPAYDIVVFATDFRHMRVSASDNVADVLRKTSEYTFGSTDCSLPMRWATQQGVKDVDVFVVITDNETWAGYQHVAQALDEYRRKNNPSAKLMVLATSSTSFSIADPADPLQLDVAGFDGSIGQVIAEFARLRAHRVCGRGKVMVGVSRPLFGGTGGRGGGAAPPESSSDHIEIVIPPGAGCSGGTAGKGLS